MLCSSKHPYVEIPERRQEVKKRRTRRRNSALLTRLAGTKRKEVTAAAQKRLLKPLPKKILGRRENQGEAMSKVSTW